MYGYTVIYFNCSDKSANGALYHFHWEIIRTAAPIQMIQMCARSFWTWGLPNLNQVRILNSVFHFSKLMSSFVLFCLIVFFCLNFLKIFSWVSRICKNFLNFVFNNNHIVFLFVFLFLDLTYMTNIQVTPYILSTIKCNIY